MDELVGVGEVGDLLGVSRQRVDQLAVIYGDFPPPIAQLRHGRVWKRAEIDAWMVAHPDRKAGRPPLAKED